MINNGAKNSWFEVTSYKNDDAPEIIDLISKIYHEISQSKQEYVKFYLEKHKFLPMWIVLKTINFSTLINFIDYSKDELKDSICDLYDIHDSLGNSNYKLLIGSLHWMRKIRNICAHNERVYCLKRDNGRIVGTKITQLGRSYVRSRTQKVMDLLIYLSYYLDPQDNADLINHIKILLHNLQQVITIPAYENVRGGMGIKNITDLDFLLTQCVEKKYNSFK